MVRELDRSHSVRTEELPSGQQFPATAPAANPVFFRTYSRRTASGRETWEQVGDRTLRGLIELGKLSSEEAALIQRMQQNMKTFPSGRWLWVGGIPWLENQQNFSGGYNCTSTNVTDWRAFGLMMDLAMMGCGTGAILEPKYINQLPPICNRLVVTVDKEIGSTSAAERREQTQIKIAGNRVSISVGDSRSGWVKSYQALLELSTDPQFGSNVETGDLASVQVAIDLSHVRPAGEPLKGFGGVANPIKLPGLYQRCAAILNKAIGRQLNSVECCLLIDEAAVVVVAGNVRRCIAYGEMVSAISGMKPIQDIAIGELVLTSSGEYKPVTDKFLQGVQDVVEIRTAETSIRCTANHRVAVYNGLQSYNWKYAGELRSGDRLISVPHRKGMPCSTADYAWLVGFFIGDGNADIASSKRRNGGGGCVAFAFSKVRINGVLGQKCLRILKSLGYTPSIRIDENQAWIKVHRKELADELIQYKQSWGTPVIPEFVWLGTEEIRGAFLAGLADADAGPSRNVLLHSNKLEFLRQIQRLALSLGIATTLHERIQKMLRGRDTVYEGCHWLKIRGIQSQVNAVALVNPYMERAGFQIYGQKKNGLSLPHQFIEEAMASGWAATTVSQTRYLISPSKTGNPKRDANWDTLLSEGIVNPHWLPLKVQLVVPAGQAETFDIEVESDREFIASGLLVHNSAGMRQGASDDELFADAKGNLWQQDRNGNWRIDPDRDALRMANHTRVFHRKPTLEECIEAVRKQYYSGEGAIQWAGEAVARANCDLLSTQSQKTDFLQAYDRGQAKEWLQQHHPNLDANELEHRLSRYGLNPCVTADTWIHTETGARQVKDLVGKQSALYVNGELFSTTPKGFWLTGVKPVYRLKTQEGFELRLTSNHKLLKVTAQTQKQQYVEWVELQDLKPGDRILLHNHREVQPWDGIGTFDEGWLLGNLIGDGSLAATQWGQTAYLRYWEESQEEMGRYAVTLLKNAVGFSGNTESGCYHHQLKHRAIDSPKLARLTADYGITIESKMPTGKVEQASYEFSCGFLRGLFDADGSVQGSQQKGVSIRLAQSNLETLKIVQRMLARLGIISTIYQNRRSEDYRSLPDSKRQPGLYFCQSQHELIISNDNIYYYQQIIGFQEPQKTTRLQELLSGYKRKVNHERFAVKIKEIVPDGVESVYDCTVPGVSRFDANGIVAHNCGEIIGANFHCNLAEVHLNQIAPENTLEQEEAFAAGGLSVATLLNHQFLEPRYQYSRELDPIVGVSFTGLFDFFVTAFGVDWLRWWEAGRPETSQGKEFKLREQEYLTRWKEIVQGVVWDYCDRHQIKRPNRCTTLQPAGTKSLLTGASPGWHPPKAQRFIRRITFAKNDPVALACIEYGYNVVPAQSDKDENGNLLDDPFDPRCTEWLVEIPVEVPWANLPGASEINISKFSALAQMDFYLQVQRYWTTHNSSATIELTDPEVEPLAERIYQAIRDDEGYISAALLARFEDHQSFPRLPFEPITKEEYDRLSAEVIQRRKTDDFQVALNRYDRGELAEAGPAGCDSDKCMFPTQ
ncbi:MAG: ribonucleoside-triphosphate reductase, adenosylcobalamin-dependent [Cyanosarcina radialis HA8281-LM2]|jgi:intein/homing endonuclease|nr:ribonucleoside-triphosphate reductase, adenosylcobalamin-dependent [Cyanosarcina radialis HA8281-LM2]